MDQRELWLLVRICLLCAQAKNEVALLNLCCCPNSRGRKYWPWSRTWRRLVFLTFCQFVALFSCLCFFSCAVVCGSPPTPQNAFQPRCGCSEVATSQTTTKSLKIKKGLKKGLDLKKQVAQKCTTNNDGFRAGKKCPFKCKPGFAPATSFLWVLCQGDKTWLQHGGCVAETCSGGRCQNYTQVWQPVCVLLSPS